MRAVARGRRAFSRCWTRSSRQRHAAVPRRIRVALSARRRRALRPSRTTGGDRSPTTGTSTRSIDARCSTARPWSAAPRCTREVVHIPDIGADPEYTYSGPRTYHAPASASRFSSKMTSSARSGSSARSARALSPTSRSSSSRPSPTRPRSPSRTRGWSTPSSASSSSSGRSGTSCARSRVPRASRRCWTRSSRPSRSLCGGDNVRLWLVRRRFLHAVANGGWTDGW